MGPLGLWQPVSIRDPRYKPIDQHDSETQRQQFSAGDANMTYLGMNKVVEMLVAANRCSNSVPFFGTPFPSSLLHSGVASINGTDRLSLSTFAAVLKGLQGLNHVIVPQ